MRQPLTDAGALQLQSRARGRSEFVLSVSAANVDCRNALAECTVASRVLVSVVG